MQRIHFQQWRIASQQEPASVVTIVGILASKIKTWHRDKNVNQRNFTILRGYHYSSDFIESHKCWTHFRPILLLLHTDTLKMQPTALEIENERLVAKILDCIFRYDKKKHLKNSLEHRDHLNAMKTMNFNGCRDLSKKNINRKKNWAFRVISSLVAFLSTDNKWCVQKKSTSVCAVAAQLFLDFTDAIGVDAYNLYHFLSLLWSWLFFIWIFCVALGMHHGLAVVAVAPAAKKWTSVCFMIAPKHNL